MQNEEGYLIRVMSEWPHLDEALLSLVIGSPPLH